MQSHEQNTSEDDLPCFIGWQYDTGITITLEGFDEYVDGEILLTWTPHVGVERGPSQVLAMADEGSIVLFKGGHEDQRAILAEWDKLAEANDRPAIYRERGLGALANLPKLPMPKLPEIDEELTTRANQALKGGRELVNKAVAGGRRITFEDCVAFAEAADAVAEGGRA